MLQRLSLHALSESIRSKSCTHHELVSRSGKSDSSQTVKSIAILSCFWLLACRFDLIAEYSFLACGFPVVEHLSLLHLGYL